MSVVIAVPSGALRCSRPAPEKSIRLRDCVQPERGSVEITSSIVIQILRGYIPESIKRLGDAVSQIVHPQREPLCSRFAFVGG